MAKKKATQIQISSDLIVGRIYVIRGKQVMFDFDLAQLYGVETKYLKRQVRRNIERFPDDFMFELDQDEFKNLKSQIGTSSWGGTRYAPMAFTEPGVAMLSSVLRSETAIQVNIQIIRTFINLRHLLVNYEEIWRKIEAMERKYDKQFSQVFKVLKQLLIEEEKPRRQIGFKSPE